MIALTLTFGPISAAHFNPAVTLARCNGRRPRVVAGLGVCHRSDPRGRRWNHGGTPDVQTSCHSCFAPHSWRWNTVRERIRRNVRIVFRDLGLFTFSIIRRAIRCWSVYYRRVLVHILDVLCESRGYDCQIAKRYVWRHSARHVPLLDPCTASGCARFDTALSMTDSQFASRC